MELAAAPQTGVWQRLDASAFGLVYGTITALGILMARAAHPDHPFVMAAALFGSVLAVTLAKAFAEVMAEELGPDAEPSPHRFANVWRHARPTLVTANVPTLLLVAAGLGLLGEEPAIGLAQGFSMLVLFVLGWPGRPAQPAWPRPRRTLLGRHGLRSGGAELRSALTGHIPSMDHHFRISWAAARTTGRMRGSTMRVTTIPMHGSIRGTGRAGRAPRRRSAITTPGPEQRNRRGAT